MYRRWAIGIISSFLPILLVAGSLCAAPAAQQSDGHKGTTVDDLARGLRSAAQNIEKEIPKIGPAVGKAVKSIAGTHSAKTHHDPSSNKK
jgi:hypothetical protein